MQRATWIGCALGLLAMASGCGGSDLTCGEGTVKMGDRCVAETGDGGTGDGGTVVCGPGTTEMDGTCVPDGTVVCTDGTVFDADTGTCVLDESACGEGTMLVDGECVAGGLEAADVTEGAENNDAFGYDDATATDFTLPASAGETTRLGGCITPADFDGDADNGFEADVDAFAFSADGPTVLRVRADGTGGLSPAFAVVPADADALEGYLRVGLDFTRAYAERKLYVPAAGNYYLLVFDGRSLDLGGLGDGELNFTTPAGSSDACYVVTVEPQEVPSPTDLTDAAATGTFGDPVAYRLAPTERTFYTLIGVPVQGPAAIDLVVHVGDDTRVGTLHFLPAVGGAGAPAEATVVVDYAYDYGLTPADWGLQVRQPEALPDGDATLTGAGEPLGDIFAIDGNEGDVVHFGFDAGSTEVTVFVLDAEGEVVALPCGTGFFGPASCTDEEAWLYLGAARPYYVVVLNDGSDDYTVTFTNKAQTPVEVGETATTVMLIDDDWTFLKADASAMKWGHFGFDNFMGTGFTNVDARLFLAPEPGELDFGAAPRRAGVTAFDRIFGPAMGGQLLVAIRESGFFATHDGDEQVDVTFASQSFEDVMVATDSTEALMGKTIAADGRLLVLVEADAANRLTFTATPSGTEDVVVEQLDAFAEADATVDDASDGEAETWVGFVPASGFVAFAVREASGAAATVDLSIEATEPPYSIADGSTTFSSICSDSTEVLDADDAITDAISWDMGFSFDFFGMATTGMMVDTNGWLTLDTSYSAGSEYDNALGASSVPNAVIAPFWTDLVTRVCVQQAADKVMVEWQGRDYGRTGTVQMQAILYDDGRIEFVYGDGHTVSNTDLAADVGLENQDGSAALPYTGTVSAGSAILFTPTM